MKSIKHTILIVIALLFVIGCQTRKIQHITNTQLIVKDSFSIIETIKYDTLVIPGDTLQTTITIECDSLTGRPVPFQVSQKSGRLTQAIAIDKEGVLTAKCKTDSLLNVISQKNREIEKYKALFYTNQDTQTKTVERCTRHKWRWYSLSLNIIMLGWLLRKPIMTILKFSTKFIIP